MTEWDAAFGAISHWIQINLYISFWDNGHGAKTGFKLSIFLGAENITINN